MLGHHVLHPVRRLDDAHGGAISPKETAGRGELEMDLLAAELDRLQPRIDQHATRAGTAVVRPRSLAAVMPSMTARAGSRRVTARMTVR